MDRGLRFPVFFFLVAMLVVASTASVQDTQDFPIDVEEIKDPELKARIAQEVAPGGEAELDSSKAPPAALIAKEKRLPFPLCGVFILCERRGGFFGFPDARLFTAFGRNIFPRTTGACRTSLVRGTSPGGSSFNHARLWPLFGEEFNEMCFYFERQHSCTTGRVSVVRGGVTLYQCDQYYDAHTVQFCLSKFPYYCRFRNPADIIFATVSPVKLSSA